jgi:hypothetical protein
LAFGELAIEAQHYQATKVSISRVFAVRHVVRRHHQPNVGLEGGGRFVFCRRLDRVTADDGFEITVCYLT